MEHNDMTDERQVVSGYPFSIQGGLCEALAETQFLLDCLLPQDEHIYERHAVKRAAKHVLKDNSVFAVNDDTRIGNAFIRLLCSKKGRLALDQELGLRRLP